MLWFGLKLGSQCSSAVEQRFRKPSVAGSIPAIGSILNCECSSAFIVSVVYPMKSPTASMIGVVKLITTFMRIEGIKAGIFSAFW